MGVQDVTIYTCDGCRVKSTVPRGEAERGFTRILLGDDPKLLCSVCYRAVEWVVKSQRITVPPKVYRVGRTFSLRKPDGR